MVENEQLPPVRDRLKGLKERDLVVLKVLMKVVEYNRVSIDGIKDLLPDLSISQVVRVLKRLERRRLVGSEKLGRHRVWGIINKATYKKLIDLISLEPAGRALIPSAQEAQSTHLDLADDATNPPPADFRVG